LFESLFTIDEEDVRKEDCFFRAFRKTCYSQEQEKELKERQKVFFFSSSISIFILALLTFDSVTGGEGDATLEHDEHHAKRTLCAPANQICLRRCLSCDFAFSKNESANAGRIAGAASTEHRGAMLPQFPLPFFRARSLVLAFPIFFMTV
jgi:hypothetical protein